MLNFGLESTNIPVADAPRPTEQIPASVALRGGDTKCDIRLSAELTRTHVEVICREALAISGKAPMLTAYFASPKELQAAVNRLLSRYGDSGIEISGRGR